ncbi:hypothetical protein CVT26_013187 [Gymnopilus dilepis]|uniref:Uncharacterized protein n=1 Tax=Gymnopilus dilepis TaxID=231916 RepID=A0A409VWE0_9AGAR|nr:hypothetical protein CVT26_013187 [Gymnopilus dilepis]
MEVVGDDNRLEYTGRSWGFASPRAEDVVDSEFGCYFFFFCWSSCSSRVENVDCGVVAASRVILERRYGGTTRAWVFWFRYSSRAGEHHSSYDTYHALEDLTLGHIVFQALCGWMDSDSRIFAWALLVFLSTVHRLPWYGGSQCGCRAMLERRRTSALYSICANRSSRSITRCSVRFWELGSGCCLELAEAGAGAVPTSKKFVCLRVDGGCWCCWEGVYAAESRVLRRYGCLPSLRKRLHRLWRVLRERVTRERRQWPITPMISRLRVDDLMSEDFGPTLANIGSCSASCVVPLFSPPVVDDFFLL